MDFDFDFNLDSITAPVTIEWQYVVTANWTYDIIGVNITSFGRKLTLFSTHLQKLFSAAHTMMA